MKTVSLVGIYGYFDDLLAAVRQAKEKSPHRLVVYSPIPSHELEEELEPKPSPVRYFTLAGALTGLFGGFSLAIWSSLKWGQIVSGKPVVSIPPFVVVGFELTILFGALATLTGLIVTHLFRAYKIKNTYDPRFSADKFGLAVQVPEERKEEFTEIFQSTGAEEVHVR
ncbi:MAG TPA: DUF3341 domain-containing protein [Bacteroidetes bacterium]|nr:DUF3341 domain-containing protein [Bacteroidota bacterium]